MSLRNHKDLTVWKRSFEMVIHLYKTTANFPKDELYGLTSQIRRAAVSIPSNIAEGAARSSRKEFIQFLYISLGSLSELETQILIAAELKYLVLDELLSTIEEIRKMLLGLIKKLKNTDH